eukprot:TRINITY_DN6180_c0_g1_i4.p2 TRINITY_DN6180_c0_g1~~TRINITY_DN6180_c0_g1_i4.p2  ORF type:complete len:127 (-),score=31.94 TRINITY_DN6180_c0_g1_i4:371-751(-)
MRFDAVEENPEHSMAWSLRGRVRFMLGYPSYKTDFKQALRFAPDSFAARAMHYLCLTEAIVSDEMRDKDQAREQTLGQAREVLVSMQELDHNLPEQKDALEGWQKDMESYEVYHNSLKKEGGCVIC